MSGVLSGKVAIVTGGGRGIGRAIALAFAGAGARVVVNDRGTAADGTGEDPSVAAAVAAEIGADRAVASADDVGTPAGAAAVVDLAERAFGPVDALAHLAGFVADAPIADLDDARWAANLSGLLGSAFYMTRAVSRRALALARPAQMLCATSMVGIHGSAGLPSYSAAKAGIIGLCRSGALDLQPHRVTFNVLSPLACTRLTEALLQDVPDAATALHPDFVADVAVFLVSPSAAEVTGEVVDVQGPRVSIVRSARTDGLVPRDGGSWSVAELAARWSEMA